MPARLHEGFVRVLLQHWRLARLRMRGNFFWQVQSCTGVIASYNNNYVLELSQNAAETVVPRW